MKATSEESLSSENCISQDMIRELSEDIRDCNEVLRESGLLRAYIEYWIRCQIAKQIDRDGLLSSINFESIKKKWVEKNSAAAMDLNEKQLENKILVPLSVQRWSRLVWGSQVQSLYLARKTDLDTVSIGLIRISDKGLASEVYHMINAGECSFEKASSKYGEGKERLKGGRLEDHPIGTLPEGLFDIISKLDVGQLSMPLRVKEGFWIVRLYGINQKELDKKMEEALIGEQFRLWLGEAVERVLRQLD